MDSSDGYTTLRYFKPMNQQQKGAGMRKAGVAGVFSLSGNSCTQPVKHSSVFSN